jgi:hypothetical protein
MNETCAVCQKPSEDWICECCRRTAVATIEPAAELPPAIEATNPSEIERAIFLRSLREWDQFWVEIIIRSGIAANVRDALVEHRAVAEARR